MSALLHSGKTITSRSFGVECIQPSMEVSNELCISSSCISSFSFVQVSTGTCHKQIQTSYSGGIMLYEGSLASHSSQHVGRHSSSVSYHKKSHHGCFSRPGAQGSAIAAFNPWLLRDMSCTDKGSLPHFVWQWQGQLEHLQQKSTSIVGRSGKDGVLERVYQTMPFLPVD